VRALAFAFVVACTAPKLTAAQCEELVDRYTEIALRESFPDASAETVASQKSQVRALARTELAKCTDEITPKQRGCAMRAESADAFERCLSTP